MDKVVYSSHYRYSFLLVVPVTRWCKGGCFMTQTFFFALFFFSSYKFVTLFVALSLSHFFSLGRRRRRRRRGKDRGPSERLARKSRFERTPRESARHRCGRLLLVVLRRRKESSSSSSSKRGGKIDFHSADSRENSNSNKWPTRRRRPKSRRLMVVRLRLHTHPPRNNTNTKTLYPWWCKSQRWTGPCTRPASCPFYSAFTTLVPMRSESRSLEFAFELVAVFLLFFL